jgi:hypothetical protein
VESPGSWLLAEWDTDTGLEGLVLKPTQTGNAAQHFQRLDELYRQRAKSGTGPLVEELLQAANLDHCQFAPEFYPPFTTYSSAQPDFLVLRTALDALLTEAKRRESVEGDLNQAERHYQAALAVGRHLTSDRYTLVVYMSGIILKLRSSEAYTLFLDRRGDKERANQAREYAAYLAEVLRLFHWKARTAMGSYTDFASLPALIEIAQKDQEPCWRAEAALRLAILRHGAPDLERGEIAHQTVWEQAAEQALSDITRRDPWPSVRRLAGWAVLNINPGTLSNLPPVLP